MLRLFCRVYCKIATQTSLEEIKHISETNKLDFTQKIHRSKVPQTPLSLAFPNTAGKDIDISFKTIQLLECLSLVDLESTQALITLKSSIQFADQIAHINTSNVLPLYTVLEEQQLQLRNDQVTEGNYRAELLSIAKVSDEDYYVTPPGNIPLKEINEQ